jgi:hypothetical protein
MVKKEEGCCRKQENNEELTSRSLSYIAFVGALVLLAYTAVAVYTTIA